MKKLLLVALCLGGALLVTSCNKVKTCKCREINPTAGVSSDYQSMDPESWGAKNCTDLQAKLRIEVVNMGFPNNYFECEKE